MLKLYTRISILSVITATLLMLSAQSLGQNSAENQLLTYSQSAQFYSPEPRGIVLADVSRGLYPLLIASDDNDAAGRVLSWSPDGGRFATNDGFDIYLSTADFRVHNISHSPDYAENDPVWSPDGRRLAFTASSGNYAENNVRWYVGIIDIEHEQPTYIPLPEDESFIVWQPIWSPDGRMLVYLTNKRTDGGAAENRLNVLDVERQQI